jgi:hypothetical protein
VDGTGDRLYEREPASPTRNRLNAPHRFVVNARDAAWVNNDSTGGVCIFESDDFVLRGRPDLNEYVKPGTGFTLRVVSPGQPAGLYHAESVEEDVRDH